MFGIYCLSHVRVRLLCGVNWDSAEWRSGNGQIDNAGGQISIWDSFYLQINIFHYIQMERWMRNAHTMPPLIDSHRLKINEAAAPGPTSSLHMLRTDAERADTRAVLHLLPRLAIPMAT